MKTFTRKAELVIALEKIKNEGEKIAFVPTMGALHAGHLALIEKAKKEADRVVCSIFVNPTQFNDKDDLLKYPRPIESDLEKLKEIGCDIIFLPSVEEIYEENETWEFELGKLDQIWEGKLRPGHFQGVTQIVYKLFSIVKPDVAVFGQKDFQQCAVIQYLIKAFKLPIELIIHPIVREEDGLAMSSRNVRLSEKGRKTALSISQTLFSMQELYREGNLKLDEITKVGFQKLDQVEGVKIEYLAICDTETLEERYEVQENEKNVILVVAWVDGIRLLDNLLLN